MFRANGFSERQVALWVAIAFGAAHSLNLFTGGASALLQVLVTMAAGYFLYLVLRATGSLVVAMLLHAFWDLGLFTGLITDDIYVGGALFVLADIVMAIILLVRRRHIELEQPAPAAATS